MNDQQYKFQGAQQEESKLSRFDWVQQQLNSSKWQFLGQSSKERQENVVSMLEKSYERYELDYAGRDFSQEEVTNRGYGGTEAMQRRGANIRANETAEESAARLNPISESYESRFGNYKAQGFSEGYSEKTPGGDLGYGRNFVRQDGTLFEPYGKDFFSPEALDFRKYIQQKNGQASGLARVEDQKEDAARQWVDLISNGEASLTSAPQNLRLDIVKKQADENTEAMLKRFYGMEAGATKDQLAEVLRVSTGPKTKEDLLRRQRFSYKTNSDTKEQLDGYSLKMFGDTWGSLDQKQKDMVESYRTGGTVGLRLPSPPKKQGATNRAYVNPRSTTLQKQTPKVDNEPRRQIQPIRQESRSQIQPIPKQEPRRQIYNRF